MGLNEPVEQREGRHPKEASEQRLLCSGGEQTAAPQGQECTIARYDTFVLPILKTGDQMCDKLYRNKDTSHKNGLLQLVSGALDVVRFIMML